MCVTRINASPSNHQKSSMALLNFVLQMGYFFNVPRLISPFFTSTRYFFWPGNAIAFYGALRPRKSFATDIYLRYFGISPLKGHFHYHILETNLLTNSLTNSLTASHHKQMSHICVLFVSKKLVVNQICLLQTYWGNIESEFVCKFLAKMWSWKHTLTKTLADHQKWTDECDTTNWLLTKIQANLEKLGLNWNIW
jgi:hypothetical protein